MNILYLPYHIQKQAECDLLIAWWLLLSSILGTKTFSKPPYYTAAYIVGIQPGKKAFHNADELFIIESYKRNQFITVLSRIWFPTLQLWIHIWRLFYTLKVSKEIHMQQT